MCVLENEKKKFWKAEEFILSNDYYCTSNSRQSLVHDHFHRELVEHSAAFLRKVNFLHSRRGTGTL